MRRFFLMRNIDRTGISGTGKVAEGVQFSNGKCTLAWLTKFRSIGVYDSISDVEAIHGHGGDTQIVWLDEGI